MRDEKEGRRSKGLTVSVFLLAALAAWALALTGCDRKGSGMTTEQVADGPDPAHPVKGGGLRKASARIEPRSGSQVTGTAVFEEKNAFLHMSLEVSGASPGEHGVHIHEKGDCSAPDASSAGPHFNPTGSPHGGPTSPEHHAGDFGNFTVGADGKGVLKLDTKYASLRGPDSIVGRSIVIHEKGDDLRSQPAGNSGARVGCGVIR